MIEQEQIEEKIKETKGMLQSLENELGQMREVEPVEAPLSFSDSVEGRMSPAEEVSSEETTPQLEEAMGDSEEESGGPDMKELYEIVYDESYDQSSESSESKMRLMKEAIKSDPRVMGMAVSDPTKFALYMYGRNSTIG
tara:strand:- start:45 stop:461 length:417 start_codon:yes stop_codon:yes gene_type:complete